MKRKLDHSHESQIDRAVSRIGDGAFLPGRTFSENPDRWTNHVQTVSSRLVSHLGALVGREPLDLLCAMSIGLKILLYRYSGDNDATVGMAMFPTDSPHILTAKINIQEGQTFRQLLDQESAAFRGTRRRLESDASEPLQGGAEDEKFTAILAVESGQSRTRRVDFHGALDPDLFIVLKPESPDRMQVSVSFNSTRFESGAVERILLHYLTALQSALEAPDIPIDQLTILPATERSRLLTDFSGPRFASFDETSILRMFENQVKLHPDKPAVECDGTILTYEMLNERAGRLARHLRSKQVGPGTRVGIHMARSIWLPVAILGTLRAGGTYVPIDPEYPRERVEFMITDSEVSILVTQLEFAGRFKNSSGTAVVYIDADNTDVEGDLKHAASDNCDAYITYTSGSTGRPKGVKVTHRSLFNFVKDAIDMLHLNERDTMLAITTISFDISLVELLLPLLVGAKIVIAPVRVVRDGQQLGRVFETIGPTIMQGTPTMWQMLVQAGWVGNESLRLITIGEPLTRTLANDLLERSKEVWNCYGPTETTIWSTAWQVLPDPAEIAIGRPIANTLVYVLDDHLQPVPLGVPGELFIGGSGVAAGYLNRPDVTQVRFVKNPFEDDVTAQMYRTGDFVLFRSDGQLVLLGRKDRQVKIRGHRIELEEIESVLAEWEHGDACAVMCREDDDGERKLVAYVKTTTESQFNRDQCLEYLRSRLPQYMVPSILVGMDYMPLSPSGKIDYANLPDPKLASHNTKGYPRTETEARLAKIWGNVLGKEDIGTFDNFFDLGGNSLSAIKLVKRIGRAFGIEVPIKTIFERPTISELATTMGDGAPDGKNIGSVPSLSNPDDELFPLSFGQQRLWFLQQLQPGSPAYNIPFGFRMTGKLDERAFSYAVNEVVRRHGILRTTFDIVDGQAVQHVHRRMDIKVKAADLRAFEDSERELKLTEYVQTEAHLPFSLESGPLIRVSVLTTRDNEHLALFVVHHICFDLSSIELFLGELAESYSGNVNNRKPRLSNLEMQYGEFAAWQRQNSGRAVDDSLSYWKAQLAGISPTSGIPTDYPRPAVQSFHGGQHTAVLSAELCESLKELGRHQGTTMFMTLLSSLQTLLYRYTGNSDVVIGVPMTGRETIESESLIGFFSNSLVLRTNVVGSMLFRDLLQQSRHVVLAAYDHMEAPFERIVEQIHPDRMLSHTPLFQVMFAYQGNETPTVEAEGLQISVIPVETKTSKFDLTLFATETASGLDLTFEYSADIFKPETIARMSHHLTRLLEQVAVDPSKPVSRLEILTPEEKEGQINPLNVRRASFDQPVHILFENQVRNGPHRNAVRSHGTVWTYFQLNQWANRIAHVLLSKELPVNRPIGICMDRSPESIAIVLAASKCGLALLALNPHPENRLISVLEDARPSTIITNLQEFEGLSELDGIVLEHFAGWQNILSGVPAWNPDIQMNLDGPIYIVYTSGSTGRPKGVQISYNLLNQLVNWQIVDQRFEAVPTMHFAPLTFDVAFQEIFSVLGSGGELIIAGDEERRDPLRLLKAINENSVERLYLPVVALQQLAEAALFYNILPSSLRDVITAGEQLRITPTIREFFNGLGSTRLHNQYGPCETHVATSYTLPDERADWDPLPPIGFPVARHRVYVLDRDSELAPTGVFGELCISGRSLPMGYLNFSGSSEGNFISDPFVPGNRIYRTGDIGRYLDSGAIEFLGRVDHQVKIRGYRVELGEVEAALLQLSGVQKSAVTVPGIGSNRRLVAHVVLDSDEDAVAMEHRLKQELRKRVPEYMVPQSVVRISAMPLTSSGKVDRLELTGPSNVRTRGPHAEPTTETEKLICEVWKEVLQLDRVGLNDNFFDIGGHSLLVVQVCKRLSNVMHKDVETMAMFRYPTVASLAASLVLQSDGPEDACGLVERAAVKKDNMKRRGDFIQRRRQNSIRKGGSTNDTKK